MSQSIYTRLTWFHEHRGNVSSDRWILGMYMDDSDLDKTLQFLRAGSFMGSI